MNDPDVTIRLPLSAWRVVAAHLEAGIFRDVAEILFALSTQSATQLEAAHVFSRALQIPSEQSAPAAAQTPTAPQCDVPVEHDTGDAKPAVH